MDSVTLVLTRTPPDEFIFDRAKGQVVDDIDSLADADLKAQFAVNAKRMAHGGKPVTLSGRWGSMLMLRGPRVHGAHFADGGSVLGHWVNGAVQGALGHVAQSFPFANRTLELYADPGTFAAPVEFSTAERYRGSTGGLGKDGYVFMPPRAEPYGLRVERGNHVVKTLRPGHSGDCVRVLGGATRQQRGILIHEAPNVGWVIGCIGPRPKGNRGAFANRDGNPSNICMREILREMTAHGHGEGQLFVLD